MSFGVSGLMSGLDTESIIKQMMAIERRPILLLQQREATYQSKISSFGTLKAVLGELQSAAAALGKTDLFAGFSASSENSTLLTASASASAVAGTYQVTVKTLAQAQQVKSSSFTAGDEVVGTGILTIQVGAGPAVEVSIDAASNTLTGIAQAINNAGAGVTAGVVNDGLGNFYLTLASKETGASNSISLTMTDADGINNDAGGLSKLYENPAEQVMSETMAAGNAKLMVNGIEVERAGNTIDDLLAGVTLTLKAADPTVSFAVQVSRDLGSISSKIKNFVDKYNNARTSLNTLQLSGSAGGAVGPLQGDSTARMVQARLRTLLSTRVEGVADSVNSLSVLGVTADKDGKLSFDSAVFTAAYEANREDVMNFFTQSTEGSQGFAVKVDALLEGYLQKNTGLLVAKEEGFNRSIKHIGDQVERIEFRLAKREENLRRQFNSLESLLAQLQNTSGALTQQLDALSNLNAQISYKKK
jgi:flagellar hook-associated protein 2